MTFDELLESYDPIDVEYKKQFYDDAVSIHRQIDPKYVSFIPSKEEAEKILLVDVLKRLIKIKEKRND